MLITKMALMRPRQVTAGRREESGFTLIELVIVIVIIPILIGGVTTAIIASLRNDSTVYNRLSDSTDAQIASADFARDVQSASQLTTGASGECGVTRTIFDGSLLANSTTLTSPSASFSAADVGMTVSDTAAGHSAIPATPMTTIVAVAPALNEATLSAPATASASGDTVTISQGRPLLGLRWNETTSRTVIDGQLSGNNTLASTSANFTSADAGSTVSDPPSIGGAGLIPSGASIGPPFTSTTATMNVAASGSTTGDHVIISRSTGAIVTYWDDPVGTGSTTTYELIREFCTTSSTSTLPPTASTLAHDLPVNQGPAVITCGPSIPAGTCTPGYLSSHWLYLTPPDLVTNPNDGVTSVDLSTIEPLSGYQYNLSATPRYSNPGGSGVQPGGSPVPPLLVLQPGGTVVSNPSAALNVTGQIALNSSADIVDLGAFGTMTDSNPAGLATPFAVYQCSASCNVITNPSAYTGAPPTSVPSPFATPLVPQPNTPSPGSMGSCNHAFTKNATVTCTPGIYPGALNIMNDGVSVTFTPGVYLFQGPVTEIGISDSISFGAGTYTFDPGGGMALSATGNRDSVLGNGVFFYIETGQVQLGQQPKGSIQISPTTSGPYVGVDLYQVPVDTDPLGFSASANNVDNLAGAIEAPGAQVNVNASTNAINFGFVAAQTLTVSSSGTVNILG